MFVISVINQKGGCGKTTISTNLAATLASMGHRVVLVDSDPQGSARDWAAAGEVSLVPVVGIDRPVLDREVRSLGFDIVIIDGAPSISDLAVSAIKSADLVLIPVQPSPYDAWAVSDLVDLVKARQEITNGKLKAAFVISRAIDGTILDREIGDTLNDYGLPTLAQKVHNLEAYKLTAMRGQAVTVANTPAKREIGRLAEEILGLLGITSVEVGPIVV